MSGIDAVSPADFKQAMGHFPAGVTVVSACDPDGLPYGITASSFGSLSLDPPLVQWSIIRNSYSYPIFRDAKYFAVNVLAADQEAVSRAFTQPIDRFATVDTEKGLAGLPLIRGSVAWIECSLVRELPGGDHAIFIGRVERCRVFDKSPLIIWRRQYVGIDG